MPRKSPGHDSRMITYRTLPGSSTRYQRVNVGECTAWVQTNLEFDLEVQHPDQTTETKPFIIDTFCQHHGAVEPTLYLTPSGKWVRCLLAECLVSSQSPALYRNHSTSRHEVAVGQWLSGSGLRRSRPTPEFAIGEAPRQSNSMLTGWLRDTCHRRKSRRKSSGSFTCHSRSKSAAIKLVDDWLQSIKADSPARRQAVPHGGTKPKRAQRAWNRQAPARKEVDDCDD